MKLLWLPQIVFDSDGGGGGNGGGGNDSGSSSSTPAPAPAPKTVKVKSGDNLTKIAKANNTTVDAIVKANKIENKNKIYAGSSLKIPTGTSQPKTGTSSKSKSRVTVTSTNDRTPVSTSFADAILSGSKTNVLAPTLTEEAQKASTPNIFEKAAAAKRFKDDYGIDVSKPVVKGVTQSGKTVTIDGKKVDVGPKGAATSTVDRGQGTQTRLDEILADAAAASGFTVSDDKMSDPYEATGGIFTSLAQKSPGYLGVQGTPQNDYEKFLERYNAQSIAAAADPYGMSTATGVAITPAAQKMLDDAGMTAGEYQKAVMDLGASLDDPRFGEGMVGTLLDATMVGKGLDYLADMPKRRAYEQLTGQYEATPLGKLAGYGGADVARVVPVIKDGKIVGSLEVNSQGEAVSYTGDRGSGAKPADSTVTGWEDKVAAPRTVADIGDGGDDGDAAAGAGGVGITPDPVCPEGYVYDKDKGQCVIDPFQQPFQDASSGASAVAPAVTLSPYTAALPNTLPALMPSYVAGSVPVAPTAPAPLPGLAGLKTS